MNYLVEIKIPFNVRAIEVTQLTRISTQGSRFLENREMSGDSYNFDQN